MTEKKSPKPVEIDPSGPIIYFDRALTYGMSEGIGNVTLEAIRHVLGPNGAESSRVVTAHLRMGAVAAKSLRDALDAILLQGETPAGSAD